MKRDINRLDLLKEIGKEFPYGKGAEIGTFKGEFSKDILQNWGGTLYMIDVWKPLSNEEYLDSSNHGTHKTAYSDAMDSISGFEDRGLMIRAASKIASKIFADESLNFVYIDANHAYDYVVEDIEVWFPKIKKGGYLCGHDYIDIDWYSDPNFLTNKKDKHVWSGNNFYHGIFGVNPAVDEFCEKQGYELTLTNEWFSTWIIKK